MLELGHTTGRKPPFKYAAYTRVGFSDTDAQGIVYYGRYLPYFDLARVEYHRHLGLLGVDGDYEFVMRASSVEYLRSGAIRRPDRGLHPACAHRAHEHHLRERRLPGRRRRPHGHSRADAGARRPRERKACPIPEAFVERLRDFEGADLEVGARA